MGIFDWFSSSSTSRKYGKRNMKALKKQHGKKAVKAQLKKNRAAHKARNKRK